MTPNHNKYINWLKSKRKGPVPPCHSTSRFTALNKARAALASSRKIWNLANKGLFDKSEAAAMYNADRRHLRLMMEATNHVLCRNGH